MTESSLLLSTAYFPPVHYMAMAAGANKILIEKEENYIKQTYRNRCLILSPNGILTLSVPVLKGTFHKRDIKDIRIDYSRRWQQIHLRSIISSYRAAPFFEFYYERVENIILKGYNYLLDLNMASLEYLKEIIRIPAETGYTVEFTPVDNPDADPRYFINPKKPQLLSRFRFKQYIQVFSDRYGFVPGLSTLDLIFNTGPDAGYYLPEINL